MGAAFLAPGEALVDAVAVGLVGNDEDAAVGGSGRGGKQEGTGREVRRKVAWRAPAGEETAVRNRPKRLIMINHGPLGAAAMGEGSRPDRPQIGHKQGLDDLPPDTAMVEP